MKKERRREIISNILKVTREEENENFRIIQKAYLHWRNSERYFDFLLDDGFIAM